MSTQVQFRRGTTSDISTFVGASGEVIVDTTKHTCVVNDGVQVAGYPLLREDGSNSSLIPGSTSSCSLKFANDSNTGIISPGSDQIALVTGGATRLAIDSAGSVSIAGNLLVSGALSGSFQFSDGSAASPSITFINDPDTGIFRGAANQIGIATGGTERLRVDSAGAATIFNSLTTTNSNTAASFIPTGGTAPANGIYLPTTNTIGIATNSTARFTVSTTAASSTLPIDVPLGSVSAPPITFTGDLNTGIYSPGADQVAISTNGTGRLFVGSDGKIGIGTSPGAELLTVNGRVQCQWNAFSNGGTTSYAGDATSLVTGATAGMWAARSDSALLFAISSNERMRLDSSGRLGLGTSSPSYRLTVSGASADAIPPVGLFTGGFTSPITSFTARAGLEFIAYQSATNPLFTKTSAIVANSDGTVPSELQFWTKTNGESSPAERLRITSAGNVGIGTTSPAKQLDIAAASSPGSFATVRLTAPWYTTWDITNDSGLSFTRGATEVGRFDSSGRLLVGTSSAPGSSGTAPYAKIQVEGNTFQSTGPGSIALRRGSAPASIGTGASIGQISFAANDNSEYAWIEAYSDGASGTNDYPGRLVFSTTADGASSPTERMRLDSSGRLGLGTSTVPNLLTVNDTGAVADFVAGYFGSNAVATGESRTWISLQKGNLSGNYGGAIGGYLAQGVGGGLILGTQNGTATPVERFRIDNQGRVGIGTTSPAKQLDIAAASSPGSFATVRLTAPWYTTWDITNDSGLSFTRGATEVGRFDSSGRLLVGTSTARSNLYGSSYNPLVQIETSGALTDRTLNLAYNNAGSTAGGAILSFTTSRGSTAGSNTLVGNNDELGSINFLGADGTKPILGASVVAYVDGTPGANDMPGRLVFSTTADGASSPTERMRITNQGILNLNGQRTGFAAPMSGSGNVRVAAASGGGTAISTFDIQDYTAVQFVREVSGTASQVGTITCTSSATAYNTSSDYRLKENVVPLTDAVNRIKRLQVHRFNFIIDPDKTVDGFLAHEAQAVVPECVTGTKDEVDENGTPVYQGIDQSKLVPLLTAALQEALAEIESLKARLDAAGI